MYRYSITAFPCPLLAKPHPCLFILLMPYLMLKLGLYKQESGLAGKGHGNAVIATKRSSKV